MKLRGFKIHTPDFSSKPQVSAPSKRNKDTILLPLQSFAGVGPSAAIDAAKSYEKYGDKLFEMTREEIENLRIEVDGKNKKAFGKKFLDSYFGEKV